jgi:hypothetical protein
MVQKLFENFLDGPDSYAACERYWERIIREIEESLEQPHEWRRWIPRYNTPWTSAEADGDVIIDGRSERLNRAFRVLQHRQVGDELGIAAWLTYEKEYVEMPREELVINLCLSAESEEIAKKLLTDWMSPSTTFDQMAQIISPYGG